MEDKALRYKQLVQMAEGFAAAESDAVAVMANIAAAIHEEMHFWWTGFYRVVGSELVLGPFQGPIACTRIKYGRGVCGTAWEKKQTLIVADVEKFPGHIACSSASRSEVVVPVIYNGEVLAVIDIDSQYLNHFDETDGRALEQIAAIVAPVIAAQR